VKAARERGVRFGRRPKLTKDQLAEARETIDAGKHSREHIAVPFNVGRRTLYRALCRVSIVLYYARGTENDGDLG
jgi:DNA invertase Pin-like site-specific DNA recombinase